MGKNLYTLTHRVLHFKQPARTSRGEYTERDVWYITLSMDGKEGMGECAPLPDLSCDALPLREFEERIRYFAQTTCDLGRIPYEELRPYPSILFGLECAMRKVHGVNFEFPEEGPIINGLIWMGNYEEMCHQLERKLADGFHCIKLKIGAINFEDELSLIERIRRDYPQEVVEIRVDANGQLIPKEEQSADAMKMVEQRMERLAELNLHSIEQPIRQGQWKKMGELCRKNILPIALDEELIGINLPEMREALLEEIKPQYIVLKPSLHGGLSGCDQWIRLASERGIGWWATSALESNVGLADIARWTMEYKPTMPQGLGTGLLFTDNTEAETEIRGERLYFKKAVR